DELAAVEHEGLWSVARVHAEAGVPERLARQRIVGDEVASKVAAEEQLTCGAQKTHRTAASCAWKGMPPPYCARFVVHGEQRGAERPDPPLRGPPAFGPLVDVGQIHQTEILRRAKVKQSGVRIEARRRPV